MWKLLPPDDALRSWYLEEMLSGLVNRIAESSLPFYVKEKLVPFNDFSRTILRILLIGDPYESKSLSDEIMSEIRLQCAITYPFMQFKDILKDIEKCFDYTGQISRSKAKSYKIAKAQASMTCPYCNRNYIFTVVDSETQNTHPYGKNNKGRVARPHLDHWFDKSSNPLLSLNLFNLIPSCAVCNSSIKGTVKFSLLTHLHPYLNNATPGFTFKLDLRNEINSPIHFTISIDDSKSSLQEKATIEALCLKDIYAYHGELEGRDLYLWSMAHSNTYLQSLFYSGLTQMKITQGDAYRMFFGAEHLPENCLNRPFSKLKRDLLIQFGMIDSKTSKFIF